MKTTVRQIKTIIKEELASVSQAPKPKASSSSRPKFKAHGLTVDLDKATEAVTDACQDDDNEMYEDVLHMLDSKLSRDPKRPSEATNRLQRFVDDAVNIQSYSDAGTDDWKFLRYHDKAHAELERLWKKAGLQVGVSKPKFTPQVHDHNVRDYGDAAAIVGDEGQGIYHEKYADVLHMLDSKLGKKATAKLQGLVRDAANTKPFSREYDKLDDAAGNELLRLFRLAGLEEDV